ncbi:NADH-quinone oxidoreductase subunit NuoH [Blastopirellula marina]|uniref:NADH-quinone oxidoreductase subunit H n=1 Tax=Blastopirellula marina TaxID=124 RepID=A0A2S8FF28_9BACT|nr:MULTISPECIES: NADH-quinone oxidoreductase subunit NuoH [Pirellulaceae]PQO30690.1 NADH-quinone oxidoreductase subunit NuoH [Blastopirellula marina]RCS50827.1 NADH-quinone oxidoreductase subunit NuoH [Bremerella cremea]
MGEFFAGWFPAGWEFLGYTVAALIQAFLLVNVIALGAFVFIWAERKVSGRIQDRLGPTRTGGAFGWLQSLADGIKLLSKEDLMPKDADPILFKLAPYVAFAASFSAFMALPFASGWVALHLNIGLFFLIAVLGLEVFGVILAGYSSGSKWSLFGAMRQAAQVVSYEVPLGLCVIVPLMICGTMDLVAIGDQQRGLFTNWLIFHDPFIFVVFWIYFTCAVASVNRAPFDLAEAESELVAGFLTEYSGMRWSLFFMAEYGSMILVSALAAILFFGGWNGPIPIFSALMDWYPDYLGNCWWFSSIANLFGVLCLLVKASIGVIAMMWVRWTFPRLRVDQVITMCLKYCVPIAAVCLLGVMFWTALDVPFFNDLLPAQERSLVREGWYKTGEKQADALLESLSSSADEEGEVE